MTAEMPPPHIDGQDRQWSEPHLNLASSGPHPSVLTLFETNHIIPLATLTSGTCEFILFGSSWWLLTNSISSHYDPEECLNLKPAKATSGSYKSLAFVNVPSE